MKKLSHIAAVALALVAGAAVAGPHDLGGGTGTFTFSGMKDSSFYVTLDPGTYVFTTDVSAGGNLNLSDVWLSLNHNKHDNKGELGDFTEVSSQLFNGSLSVTVPTTERIYLDVNTMMGKKSDATFNGTLTVSAVPEPASMALFGAGLALFGFMARRRRG